MFLFAISGRGRLWWVCSALPEMESIHLEKYIFKELGEKKKKRVEQDETLIERQGEEKNVF